MEINRQQLEKYRAILENKRLTIDEMMQNYKLAAAENQDRIGYEAAKSGNFDKIAQHWAARMKTTEEYQMRSQKMVDILTQQNENAAANAEQLRNFIPTPQGQQWLSQFSPGQIIQINGFVKTWAPEAAGAEGAPGSPGARLPPEFHAPYAPSGMKGREASDWYFRKKSWETQNREPSDAEWNQHNRTFQASGRSGQALALQSYMQKYAEAHGGQLPSDDEIAAEQAKYAFTVRGAGTAGARLGNIEVSVQEFNQVMPLASEASMAVPRGNFVPYNRLRNNARLLSSDPAYQEFVDANEAAISAYSATMSRSGVNSVEAQKRAARVLNTAQSDVAYQRGLAQLKKETDAVERAPKAALKSILKGMDLDTEEGPPAAAGSRAAPTEVPPAALDEARKRGLIP